MPYDTTTRAPALLSVSLSNPKEGQGQQPQPRPTLAANHTGSTVAATAAALAPCLDSTNLQHTKIETTTHTSLLLHCEIEIELQTTSEQQLQQLVGLAVGAVDGRMLRLKQPLGRDVCIQLCCGVG
jgi:hypothetical protein